MSIADVPYDQMMSTVGRKHRKEILQGLIVLPNSQYLRICLEQADDWFREHGIDPESIQLLPSEIEAAKKRKEELDFIKREARRKQEELDRMEEEAKTKTGF